MTYVQRIGTRVEAYIGSYGWRRGEALIKTSAHLMDETAQSEVDEELGAIRIDHDPMLPSE